MSPMPRSSARNTTTLGGLFSFFSLLDNDKEHKSRNRETRIVLNKCLAMCNCCFTGMSSTAVRISSSLLAWAATATAGECTYVREEGFKVRFFPSVRWRYIPASRFKRRFPVSLLYGRFGRAKPNSYKMQ